MNAFSTASIPLFDGISPEEAKAMLPCLEAKTERYARGERILRSGQPTELFGVVLSCRVRTEVTDAWGNVSILEMIQEGSLFAHCYACSREPLDVDVVADTPCEVLMLKAERIIHPCRRLCPCHAHLSTNLMRGLALLNMEMNRRAVATAPKSIRGKLLAYLSQESKRAGSRTFAIPYSQTKLAAYLGVDRSALSSELSRLRREGIVDHEGTTYRLL